MDVSSMLVALVLAQGGQACWWDPQPAGTTRPLVVVDAGHSPEDPGARSARGAGEHDFNLAVAGAIRARLSAAGRVEVEIAGAEPRAVAPRARAEAASARHAALLVSIHHDAAHAEDRLPAGDGTSASTVARGFSVHVRGDRPASVRLARALAGRMVARGFTPTAYHASRHPPVDLALGVYHRDGLALLNGATVPAAILECGFISDRDEERALADPATRERIAAAVAEAIAEVLAAPPGPAAPGGGGR